jgi:ABC-type uncharacterized transport system substrate-binding protein
MRNWDYQKYVNILFLVIWLQFICGLPVDVLAHAHVWIHNALTIHFDEQGVAGIKIEWVFDEMFSSMIIHDFDKDQNGGFEPEEVKGVEKGAFSNLKNFDYFMHVKIDGKPFKVEYVKDFKAKIIKDRVVYHFFIPCRIKAVPSYKEIRIGIYDESFYTSVTLLKDQIFYINDSRYEHHHNVELNKEEPYYMGQVYPEEIVVRFRKRHE